MHMVLDGVEWKNAIRRHSENLNIPWIREILAIYRDLGFEYLRDGGDRWGVGKMARELAPEYGIVYKTPLAPLCKVGHYGAFIGEKYADFKEYRELVKKHRENGADFIKIMISGLMDFDHCGVLTEAGYEAGEIRELIHIAHEEGFRVMAHANGARTAEAAAVAGVDSVEHGAYLDEEAVRGILAAARVSVARFAEVGGIIAPGTDAGAWAVPHGSLTEYELLEEILGDRTQEILERGIRAVRERF